ncbi:hypothetical protein O181_083766 [Austropuccinia psidii MF-1]|uniref:Uncharacterized protein n=1 Tax=Austropuccinia psidii MF-1 TaxID=1389203 RepID=A0A9Q3FPN4_9BASI|nr:hypothetical protein [Austropuccinia psidii MF-1]
MDQYLSHGLWQPPEATRSAQSAFPSTYGEFLPFLLTIRTGGCRLGAYMVLCTIMHHFCQQFNGDVFRTKFHNPISRSQNPTPILEEDYSLISLTSYGGNQKTLQGSQPPVSAGVGLVHYSGLFKRGNSQEVLHQLNQFSRHQVFQYSLDN